MILELQEPFKSLWNKGYLVNDGDGRKRVILYNSPNDRFGVTYARYLKCVELGYILPTELEVDHIDHDKTNDVNSNLQVLSRQENIAKEKIRQFEEQISYGYYCSTCELPFIISESEKKKRLSQKQEMAFCSLSCAAKYHKSISEEDKTRIKELRKQNLSSYKIAKITGFARNTVMKHWK